MGGNGVYLDNQLKSNGSTAINYYPENFVFGVIWLLMSLKDSNRHHFRQRNNILPDIDGNSTSHRIIPHRAVVLDGLCRQYRRRVKNQER